MPKLKCSICKWCTTCKRYHSSRTTTINREHTYLKRNRSCNGGTERASISQAVMPSTAAHQRNERYYNTAIFLQNRRQLRLRLHHTWATNACLWAPVPLKGTLIHVRADLVNFILCDSFGVVGFLFEKRGLWDTMNNEWVSKLFSRGTRRILSENRIRICRNHVWLGSAENESRPKNIVQTIYLLNNLLLQIWATHMQFWEPESNNQPNNQDLFQSCVYMSRVLASVQVLTISAQEFKFPDLKKHHKPTSK